jgi:hypothetical protein
MKNVLRDQDSHPIRRQGALHRKRISTPTIAQPGLISHVQAAAHSIAECGREGLFINERLIEQDESAIASVGSLRKCEGQGIGKALCH